MCWRGGELNHQLSEAQRIRLRGNRGLLGTIGQPRGREQEVQPRKPKNLSWTLMSLHFTDWEAVAQRGKAACPKSRRVVAESRTESGLLAPIHGVQSMEPALPCAPGPGLGFGGLCWCWCQPEGSSSGLCSPGAYRPPPQALLSYLPALSPWSATTSLNLSLTHQGQ